MKKLFSKDEKDKVVIEKILNTALWMGILSAVTGFCGTVMGFSEASKAISQASSISTAVIWGGVHVALSTLIFGLWIFVLTVIVVLLLRVKTK